MRLLAVVAAMALAPGLAPATGTAPYFPQFPRACVRADFTSGGSRVRAEFCRAKGGSGAAVVVLHGCGGFSTFDHRLATTLPDYGIATLYVDYFLLTPPPNRRGFCLGGGNAAKALPTWIRVVTDAGRTLRRRKGVRSVGIVGWSLGGDVALAAASRLPNQRPFGAVAAFSADPLVAVSKSRWMPPTILLFGSLSDRILLQQARRLRRELRSRVPLQLYSYPGGTHQWRGRQGAAGIAEAAAFLSRHLR